MRPAHRRRHPAGGRGGRIWRYFRSAHAHRGHAGGTGGLAKRPDGFRRRIPHLGVRAGKSHLINGLKSHRRQRCRTQDPWIPGKRIRRNRCFSMMHRVFWANRLGIIYENPNMEVPVSDTEVKANAPTRLTGEPPGKTVPPACGRVGAVEIYDERCEIYLAIQPWLEGRGTLLRANGLFLIFDEETGEIREAISSPEGHLRYSQAQGREGVLSIDDLLSRLPRKPNAMAKQR